MFKVFIYLYIFLESVLCKTWFWLFAQSGEVGAAVLVAVWVAAGKCPRLVATKWEGGSLCREWGGSSALPCIFSTHRWMSPMPRGTITTGSETALCLQPTLPVLLLVGQLPLWGGLLPPFFSDSPFLYPDPTINAKGAPGTWGGSWPPLPKS